MTPNRMEAATGVDGARRSARSAIQAFLLSETLLSVCYWSTVALVAVVGACLLYWRWTRYASVLTLPDDPWGITTPPWVVEVSLPVLLFGYLAEACRQALQGNRQWKYLMTASVLAGIVGLTQTLETLVTAR
jgi:hypothetical protein